METLAPVSIHRHVTITITSERPTQFIDVTDRLEALVVETGMRSGFVNVQTLHTTTAIVVNEHEPLLLVRFRHAARAHGAVRRRLSARRSDRADRERDGWRAAQRSCPLPRAAAAALGLPQRRRRPADARALAAGVPGRAGRPARVVTFGAHPRRRRAMKVKMILPALTEATSPFWRPIKYSLFPPLGLATLAGLSLGSTMMSRFRTSTSRRSTWTTRPTWSSSRSTSPRRCAPIGSPITTGAAARYVALGGLHVTSLPDEAARARRHDLSRSGRGHVAAHSSPISTRRRRAASIDRPSERSTACRRFAAI